MTLEITKTIKLVGNIKFDNTVVKTITADIDSQGVSTINEWIGNTELYASNRREMHKQEAAFQTKVYEVEDAVVAEFEANKQEK